MIHARAVVPYRSTMAAGALVALALLASAPVARAQVAAPGEALRINGFVTITAGRIIDGALDGAYAGPDVIDGNGCPCYTADWANAGVYRRSWSLKPESRAGVQFGYTVSPTINLGAQIVTRGSDAKPNLQWAYAGVQLGEHVEMQVGRKRIPLYYYSDFQDIGLAYPWVNAPPELYGWEATNYNGASLRYRGQAGDGNVAIGAFAGREVLKDALYQRLYYPGKTEVRWNNLLGADGELSNGPLTVRAVYIRAKVRTLNPGILLDTSADLDAYGVAANYDADDWFVLSELTQLVRRFSTDYKVTAPAFTIGAGVRLGKWTPFLNVAKYRERTDDLSQYAPQSFRRASFTLRYDLGTRSALKAQVDRHIDITRNFGGDVTVFRLSFDSSF